jgi:hypothetical protein
LNLECKKKLVFSSLCFHIQLVLLCYILVEGHRMLGTRWAALAKLLPGRPENAIKNHWHATLRCKWAQRGGGLYKLNAVDS